MPTQNNSAAGATENRKMAEQIYDMIMGDIESDLLLANIPGLDAKYASENEEEHKARMKQYKESYKKFDTELAGFMGKIKKETRDGKRAALRKKEQNARHDEEQALENLEAAFN
tara:strand:+ start:289 stop:630 length:342 start_codon:yes stop_codon:yes gene_type:complete